MSNEFDDFFADSPTFSPGESSDKQFLQPVIPSGTFHKSETSALKDDTFEWFVEDTGSYQVYKSLHDSYFRAKLTGSQRKTQASRERPQKMIGFSLGHHPVIMDLEREVSSTTSYSRLGTESRVKL